MALNVQCKKCVNLRNDWCKLIIDSPDPDMVRDCQYYRGKTNADRIRQMSDEEIANLLLAMRDYEDLVKSLRYCAEYDCTTVCPRAGTGNGCITRLKKEAADAIEDLIVALTASNEVIAKSRDKWISVEERLPEEGKSVLVCICSDGKCDITRGWYCKNQGFCCWDDAAMESTDFITHWMPLPEPPKEDKP